MRPGRGRRGGRAGRAGAVGPAAVLLAVLLALAGTGCSSSSGSGSSAADGTTTPGTRAGDDGTHIGSPASTAAPKGPTTTSPDDTAPRPSTADTPPATPAPVADLGTYPVGRVRLALVDPSRPTPANGPDAPRSAHRDLPTWVWYPARGEPGPDADEPRVTADAPARAGRYPVVVFAHGVTGKARYYEAVLRAWASAGYVVVAPDFPLSNKDSPGGPVVTDVGQQPADVSFVLDQVTGAVTPEVPEAAEVAAMVDPGRVAVAGHSLGGVTSLGSGYAICCEDRRVDAVVDWAGVLLPLQRQPSPDPAVTDRPLLIVHGDRDATVPYASSEQAFDRLHVPRWFVTLPGAGHVPPYLSGPGDERGHLVTVATLDFLDAELKDDPTGIDRMEQVVADAGPALATLRHGDG